MAERSPHIQLFEIAFSYPGGHSRILDINRLVVAEGEQIAVLGSTGAGKSTLLRLLDGQLLGWTGRTEVLGRELSPRRRQPRSWRADVGFVFQDFSLVERATVFENVRIGRLGRAKHPHLSLFGRFTDYDSSVVEQAIKDVGLQELAEQRVDRLSGGQRQRVGVARCLAQEPRILLADEPVSNLDPTSAETILRLLKECAASRGATLIISSHQPKMVGGIVQRVIGLKQGQIVLDQPAGELKTRDLTGLYGWQVADAAA